MSTGLAIGPPSETKVSSIHMAFSHVCGTKIIEPSEVIDFNPRSIAARHDPWQEGGAKAQATYGGFSTYGTLKMAGLVL